MSYPAYCFGVNIAYVFGVNEALEKASDLICKPRQIFFFFYIFGVKKIAMKQAFRWYKIDVDRTITDQNIGKEMCSLMICSQNINLNIYLCIIG